MLEVTIANTMSQYMQMLTNNINTFRTWINSGGPTGSKPPNGLIAHMTKILNITYSYYQIFKYYLYSLNKLNSDDSSSSLFFISNNIFFVFPPPP